MKYNEFAVNVDLRSRQAMEEFLKGHSRYNGQYSNVIKVHSISGLTHEQRDILYEIVSSDDAQFAWDDFASMVIQDEFEAENKGYTAGTEGRSSGHFVLYFKNDKNVRPLKDDAEDIKEMSLEVLRERVKAVIAFDKLTDTLVSFFVTAGEQRRERLAEVAKEKAEREAAPAKTYKELHETLAKAGYNDLLNHITILVDGEYRDVIAIRKAEDDGELDKGHIFLEVR